jgi:glycosyltransferase involved in cell wall biosynthesis
MRVLVVNSFSDRSEVGLWSGLVKAGISIDVICDPTAPEQQVLKDSGIEVSTLAIRHRLDFSAMRIIRQQLNARQYDILHATRNRDLSVSLIASRGMKIKHIAYRGTIGHLSRLDPASWLTYLNPRLDRIICNAEAVRQYMLAMRLRETKLKTIYKGFEADWYKSEDRSALVEFGVPKEAIVVGFAGDIRPIKGVDVLIRAMDRLVDSPQIHLLLVGRVRDKEVESLATRSSARERIHFTGFKENAAGLMGACDIFVMPSLGREGITKAVVEAMAQGVPAIVSKAGGLPEIVAHNECGLVVPPGDPEALAQAIITLASDASLRKTLGDNAKKRITTTFGMNKAIEKTLALYTELLQ